MPYTPPSGLFVPISKFAGGVDTFGPGSYINGPTGPIRVAFGVDEANNRMWAKDGSTPGFSQSDDGGTTWSANMGLPANTSAGDLAGVVASQGFIWAIYKDIGTGRWGVYRAPVVAAGTALSWSGQLLTLPAGVTTMSVNDNIAVGASGAIIVGEYGDAAGGPSLHRLSAADAAGAGTNWVTVLGPIAGTRHCHCVREDTLHPGTWYATFGDAGAIPLARSADDGVTWQTGATLNPLLATTAQYQGVQLSFGVDWIWVANDRVGASVWQLDRATLTPRIPAHNWHANLAVPGASPARTVTDAVTIAASTQVTSASAAFASNGGVGNTGDTGHLVESASSAALGFGNAINTVTNPTTMQLKTAALLSASGVVMTIWGDTWRRQAYWGAYDPINGFYYFVSNDNSAGGNRIGLFYMDPKTGRVEILDATDYSARGGGSNPIIIFNGYVWYGAAKRKLLTRAA